MISLWKYVCSIWDTGCAFFAGRTENRKAVSTYITSLAESQIQRSTQAAYVENATRVLHISEKSILKSLPKLLSILEAEASSRKQKTGSSWKPTPESFSDTDKMITDGIPDERRYAQTELEKLILNDLIKRRYV